MTPSVYIGRHKAAAAAKSDKDANDAAVKYSLLNQLKAFASLIRPEKESDEWPRPSGWDVEEVALPRAVTDV